MKPLKTLVSLSEISTCSNGFTFRDKPVHIPKGPVSVIQTGDISTSNQINLELSLTTSIEISNQKFILQPDDILFRGRGTVCASILIPKHKKITIAASPLIVIRPDKQRVLPSYLNWVLNSSLVHSFFSKLAQGSTIRSIGIKELLELEIPLPTLLEQGQVIRVSDCFNKERLLSKRLAEKKEILLTNLLLKNTALPKRTSA